MYVQRWSPHPENPYFGDWQWLFILLVQFTFLNKRKLELFLKGFFSHLIHFIDFLELLSSDCAVKAPIGSIFFLNLDSCKSERHEFWYRELQGLDEMMRNLKYFIQLGIPPCLLFHPDHPVSHRDHQGDPDSVSLKLSIALLARLKKMRQSKWCSTKVAIAHSTVLLAE